MDDEPNLCGEYFETHSCGEWDCEGHVHQCCCGWKWPPSPKKNKKERRRWRV